MGHPRGQWVRRRASWRTRGSVVVAVMVAKAVVPKLPLGWAKAGVLVVLKSSARSSRWVCSERAVFLMRARSRLR